MGLRAHAHRRRGQAGSACSAPRQGLALPDTLRPLGAPPCPPALLCLQQGTCSCLGGRAGRHSWTVAQVEVTMASPRQTLWRRAGFLLQTRPPRPLGPENGAQSSRDTVWQRKRPRAGNGPPTPSACAIPRGPTRMAPWARAHGGNAAADRGGWAVCAASSPPRARRWQDPDATPPEARVRLSSPLSSLGLGFLAYD